MFGFTRAVPVHFSRFDDPFARGALDHLLRVHAEREIVDVRIMSDRLLVPRTDTEHINDLRLIIHAKTVILDPTQWGAIRY